VARKAALELIAPRQERSQRTLDRITRAAEREIAARGVERASVPAIARRAGISVGNFYRRFASKDALLAHIDGRLLAGRREYWTALLDPGRWAGRPASAIVEAVVKEIVNRHRGHAGLLRALALKARSEYEARAAGHHSETVSRFTALLLSRPAELNHPNARRAIPFAMKMIEATAGDLILFNDNIVPGAGSRLSDDAVVREIVRAVCGYLGIAITS
jgi:AcrR family transcriptional regulator